MIIKSLTNNYTMTILNAFASNQTATFNQSQWQVLQQPELDPAGPMGFNVGLWKCLVVLAALTVGLRVMSYFFMRLLVSKFQ